MNTPALWALGFVLAITQLINLTYLEGLSSDFSDLVLQVAADNGTYNAPYTLVDKADGAWVVVNATLPDNGSYTLNVLSSSDGGGSYEETNDPSIIEVSYQEGFAQDFSNLIVAFISPDGTATPTTHSIIGMSEGQWAIIALPRPPMAGETISLMAKVGDVLPTSETDVSSEDTIVEDGFGQNETEPPDEPALETTDSANDTADSATEPVLLRFFDAKGNEHKAEGKKGKNNKMNFKLEDLPVREITFNGLNTPNSSLGLDFPKDVPAPDGRTWSQVYAIDPSALDFSTATVTVTAKGNALYKCKEWDFASRSCGGDWALLRDDLVPGEDYTITITPEDPAFAEANITIIDVQSFPVVGGNWTVRFTTTGTANLSIRAVNGTTWDDSDPDVDLNFIELRCGDITLSPVWDDTSKTVLYENYFCSDTGYETSRVLSAGEHHLEFQFGEEVDYANNDATNISACALINSSGVYTLTTPLSGATTPGSSGFSACIVISADDVLLDCQGYGITHDDSSNTAGILMNATPGYKGNVTIQNCRVSDYAAGVMVDNNEVSGWTTALLSRNNITSNAYGIYMPHLYVDVNLDGNIVANNTLAGFQMPNYFAGSIDMSCDRFIGNGKDINYTAGESSLSISITDVIFGSADGAYGANSSISHSSSSRSWGIIDWVPAPVPPSGLEQFYNKSLNITPDYIDNSNDRSFTVTMRWNSTEGGSPISEAGIQMWLINDSGSYLLNSTPNLTDRSITGSALLNDSAASSVFALYRDIGCPILSAPGVYTLENNLSGAPNTGTNGHKACVLIATNNVLLDCAGYNITHDDSSDTAGIMINAPEDSNWNNITIANCNVRDYESAVLADSISSWRKIINLTNNSLVSNTYGVNITLGYAYINTTGNLIANNTVAGFIDRNYFGDILNFTRDSFLGNGVDIAYPSGGSGFNLTLSDVLLGNAGGDYAANVSLDHWGDHTWGNISWVPSPAPPTAGLASFANKTFNISYIPYYYPTTRDYSVTLKWTPSEGAAIDESTIEMWLFNESGSFLLNDTPDLSSRGISASVTLSDVNNNTVIGLYNGFTDYNVDDCQVITSNGTYTQAANLFGAPNDASEILPASFACIKIAASNVVFDCAGFNITYDGSVDPDSTFGILLNGSLTNVTVKNCPLVDNYTYGVYLYDTSYSTVTNTTVNQSSINAFKLDYSSNNNLSACSATSNYGSGFYLVGGSSGNNLSFNQVRDSCQSADYGCAGFYLDGSTSGALYDNVLHMNNATDIHGTNNPSGFQILDTTNTLAYYNRAENNDLYGFNLESSAPIYTNNLTGNLAYNNSVHGFRIWSSYTYLAGNNATMNGDRGFLISAAMGFPAEYAVVADNYAFNNTNFGFDISATQSNFTGNLADQNGIGSLMGGDGFSITSSGYDIFDNNNATNNGRNGFSLIGASGGGGRSHRFLQQYHEQPRIQQHFERLRHRGRQHLRCEQQRGHERQCGILPHGVRERHGIQSRDVRHPHQQHRPWQWPWHQPLRHLRIHSGWQYDVRQRI